MKRIQLTISGPVGADAIKIGCTDEQADFLRNVANVWNHENPLHAQPYLEVTEVK